VARTGENGVFSVRGSGEQPAGQEMDRAGTEPEAGGPGHAGPRHGRHGGGGGAGAGTAAQAKNRRRSRLLLIGAAAVVVMVAAAVYALLHAGASQRAPGGQHVASGSGAVGPLRVLSVTPASNSRQVDGSAPVLVQFTAPLAPGSPVPVIRPAVPGTWSHVGDDAAFTPARPFRPGSSFTVAVPAGKAGVRMAGGGLLARPVVAHFTTRGYSPTRLAQLLGQLGYLPLQWSPAQGTAMRAAEMDGSGTPVSQAALAYDPPPGGFTWEPGYPTVLAGMWQPSPANVVLRGAIMAFESEHGMTMSGTVNSRLWAAVFRAVQRNERNANGYTYAIASKGLPETLTIWHDGRVVFRSLANTGIPVSPTVDGTFPVYLRYRFQIMRGTNPDGSSYADPVSYVSYFNGGDAVHYFPRGSYGSLQSLGCVELPYTAAAQAYPYLTYGSLVTVAG